MTYELIVDSFAGGGGASTGIELALGRSPDIAINHDVEALSMHEANHPATLHLPHNVWKVDPVSITGGAPVGLLWASPDCKHFSKAKGGKPVSRNIRDLAWVVVRWAKQVRPRVIILENVEEFQGWGPIGEDGMPCPDRKGETFRRWTGELRRLGYKVEWRELRACDYGAPTIRKRLFLIARRDGTKIVWPAPTHGDPKSADVRKGRLLPWRTAAEIIDWTLPCPSIFLTRDEARAAGCKRPLADATMARIAKGVKRYVLDAVKPFVIRTDMTSAYRRNGVHSSDEPLRTQTTGGSFAAVMPVVTYAQQGGSVRSPKDPLHTVTASAKDQNAVIAPYLVPRYGEREGQAPRTMPADAPIGTVVPDGNQGSLAAVHLSTMRNGDKPFNGGDAPLHTVTAQGARIGMVAAFLAQNNYLEPGHDAREPVSTIVGKGSTQSIVSAGILNLKGSDRRDADAEDPSPTICAGGFHVAEVRAFLAKYYGSAEDGQEVGDPVHTVTAKPRFGLVTVDIGGEPYAVVDIGMRMLTPRELFRAQGFPEGYIIDRGADGRVLTKTAQNRMCGNSVCPPMAAALVRANYVPSAAAPVTMEGLEGLFAEAAE